MAHPRTSAPRRIPRHSGLFHFSPQARQQLRGTTEATARHLLEFADETPGRGDPWTQFRLRGRQAGGPFLPDTRFDRNANSSSPAQRRALASPEQPSHPTRGCHGAFPARCVHARSAPTVCQHAACPASGSAPNDLRAHACDTKHEAPAHPCCERPRPADCPDSAVPGPESPPRCFRNTHRSSQKLAPRSGPAQVRLVRSSHVATNSKARDCRCSHAETQPGETAWRPVGWYPANADRQRAAAMRKPSPRTRFLAPKHVAKRARTAPPGDSPSAKRQRTPT